MRSARSSRRTATSRRPPQLLREKGLAAAAKRAGRADHRGPRARAYREHARRDRRRRLRDRAGLQERGVPRLRRARRSTRSRSEGPDAVDELEDERVELVAKLGENIEVVGAARFEAQDGEVLAAYVHPPAQKIGVLVRAHGSPELARLVAMHVAFANPRYLTRDEVPADEIEREREISRSFPTSRASPRTSGRRSSRACSPRASSRRASSPTRPGSTIRT